MKTNTNSTTTKLLACATFILLGSITANAAPGKSCKNFSGTWQGNCIRPDNHKVEPMTFRIEQNQCESIAFNGDTYPMNAASMEVSEVQSGDGKTISYASETYPYWSNFGSVLNVERHLVTVVQNGDPKPNDVRIKDTYQIGEGGVLIKEMVVNGQSVACALSLKP